MAQESIATRPWHRRLAVHPSVRGLLVLVLVVGGGLGWIIQRANVQREAVAVIKRAGGWVDYDGRFVDGDYLAGPDCPWPTWLVDLVGIDHFATVTRVEALPGARLKFADDEMAAVGRLGYLESLSLLNSLSLNDAGLAQLRGNARLKQLLIGAPAQVAGASLAQLDGLDQLEELRCAVTRLTDADLARLSGLHRLRKLDLSLREGSTAGDAGLAHLSRLQELRSLQFTGAIHVSNEGLANLGKLSKLERLDLHGARVTDLKGLTPLVGLDSLGLINVPVDDAGLAPLAGLAGLKTLILMGNPSLTDAGLVHLRRLAGLETLDLQGCKVTDAGLSTLQDCPKLEGLYLSETLVGDAGLASLVEHRRYSLIDVGRTRVTPEGLKAARAARPDQSIRDR